MISASSANTSVRSRSPFTATQWQELEHQALIYKYMVSGVPIPPELIFSVKRSLDSAPFSSRLFSHHPGGWGCFEMGFGRKVDPEPGRCRRTDGKKWRCSKEAYPDSKYCERHMHRGRNRSRKHVEVSSSTNATSATTTTTATTASNSLTSPTSTTPAISPPQSSPVPVAISAYSGHHHHQQQQHLASSIMSDQHQHQHQHTGLYPYATDYAASSNYFCLKSEPYSNTSPHSDKDYRYFQGSKEGGMDELAFFPESSVSSSGGGVNARGGFSHDSTTTLMENYTRGGYSSHQAQAQAQYHHHQTLTDTTSKDHHHHHHPLNLKQQQQHQSLAAEDQQHCFILGTDFKSERSSSSLMPNKASLKDQSAGETQKPLHHFFGEWPPKNTPTDSWLDLASNSRVPNDG